MKPEHNGDPCSNDERDHHGAIGKELEKKKIVDSEYRQTYQSEKAESK